MSTSALETKPAFEGTEEYQPYRTLSKAAVVALVVALLSNVFWLSPQLIFVPVLGFVIASASVVSISRRPEELTGALLGKCALLLSVAILLGGTAKHIYIYCAEVPDGFQRVSFYQLQPSFSEKSAGKPIPDDAMKLHGEKVFIAGYVHPGVSGEGKVQRFVLVPDMGTCCFGGQPALTDMIEVSMEGDLAIAYNQRKRKLAGVFQIQPSAKAPGDLQGGVYKLSCSFVK